MKDNGTVWAWGDGLSGQLGDGTRTDRNSPVQVSNLSGVTAISAGSFHSLAVVPDTAAPTTTASATTADGSTYNSGELTNQNVTLTLTASDGQNGSGVKETFYRIGTSGTYQLYNPNNKPSISSEGTTEISFYSTDNASNAEQPKTFTVRIDKTNPMVSNVQPTENARRVARDTDVTAEFSEDMLDSSIDTTTFELFMTKKRSSTKVDATVSYNPMTRTATLNPFGSSTTLLATGTYKAVVTTEAKDLAGNQLDQDSSLSGLQQKEWSFRVR